MTCDPPFERPAKRLAALALPVHFGSTMSSRPVRVTRSSAANQSATTSQPPSQPSSATRIRKTSTLVDAGQTSTARTSRTAVGGTASRPSTTTNSTVKPTRKAGNLSISTASSGQPQPSSSSSSRPLWNSAKINLEPGTPGALKRPTSSLAARPVGTPRPVSRQGSLLPPTAPGTERKRSSAGTAVDKSVGMEGYRADREPLKVRTGSLRV